MYGSRQARLRRSWYGAAASEPRELPASAELSRVDGQIPLGPLANRTVSSAPLPGIRSPKGSNLVGETRYSVPSTRFFVPPTHRHSRQTPAATALTVADPPQPSAAPPRPPAARRQKPAASRQKPAASRQKPAASPRSIACLRQATAPTRRQPAVLAKQAEVVLSQQDARELLHPGSPETSARPSAPVVASTA
jgi:hypothetical protein